MKGFRRWTLNLRDKIVSNTPIVEYIGEDPPSMNHVVEVIDIELYRNKVNELVDNIVEKEKLKKEIEKLKSQLDTVNKLLIGFAGKDGYGKVNEYFINLAKEQYR